MNMNHKASNVNLPACQQLAVCQILPALDDGGMERSAVDMAVAVVKAGGRALVISEGGRLVPELLRSGGLHMNFKPETQSPVLRHWRAFRLARQLKADGYNLIHSRTPGAAALGELLAKRLGTRHVTTCHGLDDTTLKRDKALLKAVVRADRIIAVSDFVTGQIDAKFSLEPGKIARIAPGINLTRFNPAGVRADRFIKLAQKWLLPDGVPVILAPARLSPGKGQIPLLKALTQLGERPFHCLLAGDENADPAFRAEVEAAIPEMGLEGKVRLTGYCEDMPAAYMLADVVVSANTDDEAFARVTAEALAMGRPMVASPRGGAGELITHGRTGWLADPEDSAALAGAISEALAMTPGGRESLARTTRALVERSYSLDGMCESTLAIYRELAADRPDGDGAAKAKDKDTAKA